jgi:Flp pilus assembly protein TadG
MMLCLLLLGAAVIASGSAVLAKRNLQGVCDGATTAAAGGLTLDQLAAGAGDLASDRIAAYLSNRWPEATFQAATTPTGVTARCETEAPVTFGLLFAHPTIHLSVDAASRVSRK